MRSGRICRMATLLLFVALTSVTAAVLPAQR